ncbi:hypothetical protein HF086_004809, partial [Spodoptera exigua]
TFMPLAADLTLQADAQPVEFLHDKHLEFLDYANLLPYQELTVTDDTVLEEHSEDPSLVQMRLLGDGVIESIMKGEVVGVMPRRSRSNLQVS